MILTMQRWKHERDTEMGRDRDTERERESQRDTNRGKDRNTEKQSQKDRERASLVAQLVKNPPALRETWVRFLGWEDPLEKGKATHSSVLAWRIPWDRIVRGVRNSGTRLSYFQKD